MKKHLHYIASALALAVIITLSMTAVGKTAITELSGLAVAQTGSLWKNVRDYLVSDNMTDGVMSSGMVFYDAAGSNADRLRGSVTNGILVDVTRQPGSNQTPADGFANPTTFQGVWSLGGWFNGTTWDRWRGQVVTVQGETLFNTQIVTAANTAGVVTIAAVAGTRPHLYEISQAWCSPAGTALLTVTHAGVQMYTAANITNQDTFSKAWPVGLTGGTNTATVITLGACGVGNVGILSVQADRF